MLTPLFIQATASAAVLTSETVAAWDAYVRDVRCRIPESVQPGHHFLSMDEREGLAEQVRGGDPAVFPLGRTPKKVPSGLIHHWQGVSYVPNATMDDVLSTVRDYAHYARYYRPAVMDSKASDSKVSDKQGATDRFSLLLMNKSLISKTALDGDYESTYIRIDDHRWYSVSQATRIQEVQNYGTPQQHTLSENQGTGLIWKLLTITRFEQRDGGVYIEVEAVALSRDIPSSLRWIVTPIVRRISKSSLVISLNQTGEAVSSRRLASIHSPVDVQRASALGAGSEAVR